MALGNYSAVCGFNSAFRAYYLEAWCIFHFAGIAYRAFKAKLAGISFGKLQLRVASVRAKHPYSFHNAARPFNVYHFLACELARLAYSLLKSRLCGFAEKDFEIWASVKFTGPKFFADSTDKNYIYIDRIVLVEPQK